MYGLHRLRQRLASVEYGYGAWLSRVWRARNLQRRLQRAVVRHVRVLLPLASVQRIAARLGGAASPLLEEEGDSLRPTLVAQGTRPVRFHGAGARPAFAADDNPLNLLQIDIAYRAQQRLEGNEAHGGVRLLQVPQPRHRCGIFNGYAQPYMRGHGPLCIMLFDEIAHQRTALGENLIDVPVGSFHRIEYPPDILVGYLLMEKVAHRIDKDELRAPPV